jgi:hypothetical protein
MLIPPGPSQSSSSGDWGIDHPRRDEVNHRLWDLSQRIEQELEKGKLTPDQARQLRQELSGIRGEERTMAKLDHGHITRAEQKALNQEENAVRRQIGRETESPWDCHPSASRAGQQSPCESEPAHQSRA